MLQALPVSLPDWLPLQQLFLVAAVVLSLAIARERTPGDQRWGDALRRRFVLGVPWGTLLTMLGVLLVYWVVQGGWANPRDPLVVPFRSYSYFYPVGTLLAGFSHNGIGHIRGNLLGTLLFAPVVEYYLGHYPRGRGAESFASLRTNPFARLLAVPVGSLLAGIFTGIFSMGPVIGFSGVVYAYAGFAAVTRPLLAVMALLAERAVDLVYRALRNPLVTREPGPSFFTPWWADIAIQGHAIGILLGVCLGLVVLARRDDAPNPLLLWFAALVFGIRQSLWAIYAPLGSNRYVLFRAVGVGIVFLFAALVVTASVTRDRSLAPSLGRPNQRSAFRVLAASLVVLSAFAVPFGLTSVSGDLPADAERVEVRDYTVTYVEGEPNQYVSLVNEWLFDESSAIRSSGVVVISERRNIWVEAVSKSSLTFSGSATVQVGGLGWRESVYVTREGWSLVGNGSSYKVRLREAGERRKLAYATDAVRAEPTIANRNVSIAPTDEGFEVLVTRNSTALGRAPIPVSSNGTSVGGLTLKREGRDLYALHDGTRVRVANRNVPRAQQG